MINLKVVLSLLILVTVSSAQATDWSKKSSWLREEAKMACDQMQSRMRTYFEDDGYKSDKIGITYCNKGGYVIKKVRLKVTRKSDGAVIHRGEKGQNLTRGYGHYFIFGIGMSNSKEELKMEVTYNIATGDKKTCKKNFVYNYKDVIWMVKSNGTKTLKNGCDQVKFEQKQ